MALLLLLPVLLLALRARVLQARAHLLQKSGHVFSLLAQFACDGAFLPAGALVDVSIPGRIQLPDSAYVLEISAEPLEGAFQLSVPENATIQLRTRQQGDRFAPLGLSGHTQKVKKWMIDHKVRQALRDQVPMLTINGTIAAIIVENIVVISEKFAVRQPDQSIIYVRFTKNMLS